MWARSVALGFFVRTGSRDETPEVSGVSHFLEHMVFKGTPRRSAFDVNRDFDAIGADYNAFTSEENTVFYAAVLPEYLTDAVDILSDILRPSLRCEDFDMVSGAPTPLFQNTEVWNDYRRTCYPNLAPASGNFLPARLVYGTDERRANPNIPSPSQQPRRNQLDPATATAVDGSRCLGTGS